MGTISVSLPSDGTNADVADYNTPVTTIVNEINGRLDNDNIKSAAGISGSKLASASVSKTQIDFSSGVWWEELGRNRLTSAGDTIEVSSFTAKKHLKVIAHLSATGGTMISTMRFNSDSGNNYARRASINGGADATATSGSDIINIAATSSATYLVMYILNVASIEKIMFASIVDQGLSGAGNAPGRQERSGKWANTSNQITTITVANSGGTGDYAIGSEVIVLGHD